MAPAPAPGAARSIEAEAVERALFFGSRIWKGRTHYLDKMTLAELVQAYFAYPAIQVYLALALLGTAVTAWRFETPWPIVAAVAATVVVYPLVWYLLHRFVLHGRYLYRSPRTAALWKRIHFDHHQDPNNLRVLFGSLYTTLPTVIGVTIPLGWLIGGPAASAAAVTTGMLVTCFYEFCHCVQHLAYKPRSRLLMRIKKLHLAHHFHNEQGNYGITNFVCDRLLGTYYDSPKSVPRSPTVFNLGYDEDESARYPWVAQLTEGAG